METFIRTLSFPNRGPDIHPCLYTPEDSPFFQYQYVLVLTYTCELVGMLVERRVHALEEIPVSQNYLYPFLLYRIIQFLCTVIDAPKILSKELYFPVIHQYYNNAQLRNNSITYGFYNNTTL